MASSAPIFLCNYRQVIRHIYRHIYVYTLICFLMALSIHYFTYTHLYLISDNRHFTFYIFRKWFLRRPIYKYLTIPIYLLSIAFMITSIRHLHPLTILALIVSTSIVLIPVHLVEFRYFILPYAIWRLNVKNRKSVTFVEILFHLVVNLLTISLFLYKPFKWPNEPENLQRFMW
jgi:alpha-1,2-glucosyltransferase